VAGIPFVDVVDQGVGLPCSFRKPVSAPLECPAALSRTRLYGSGIASGVGRVASRDRQDRQLGGDVVDVRLLRRIRPRPPRRRGQARVCVCRSRPVFSASQSHSPAKSGLDDRFDPSWVGGFLEEKAAEDDRADQRRGGDGRVEVVAEFSAVDAAA